MPEKQARTPSKRIYQGHFPGRTAFTPPGLTPLRTVPYTRPIHLAPAANTNKFVAAPHLEEVAPPTLSEKTLNAPSEDTAAKEVLPEKVVFKVSSSFGS